MNEDQYEDDTAAISSAFNRVLEKVIIGACVIGAFSLILLAWAL